MRETLYRLFMGVYFTFGLLPIRLSSFFIIKMAVSIHLISCGMLWFILFVIKFKGASFNKGRMAQTPVCNFSIIKRYFFYPISNFFVIAF